MDPVAFVLVVGGAAAVTGGVVAVVVDRFRRAPHRRRRHDVLLGISDTVELRAALHALEQPGGVSRLWSRVVPTLASATAGAAIGWLVWVALEMGPLTGSVSVVTSTLAGALLPAAITRRRARRRLRRIDDEVFVAAGLLSVEVRAGLGLDAAIEGVAAELDGDLGSELAVLTGHVRLGMSRRDALEQLRTRAPAPNVVRLVTALQHADELGAPVGATLDRLADECRTRRFQSLREDAAKLPVKMLFPIVLCIFPPMLVLLAGPAIQSISDALGGE